jgi:hypothetical protein
LNATIFCPNCGERISARARFCPSCGARQEDFQVAAPAPPVPARDAPATPLPTPDEPPAPPAADPPASRPADSPPDSPPVAAEPASAEAPPLPAADVPRAEPGAEREPLKERIGRVDPHAGELSGLLRERLALPGIVAAASAGTTAAGVVLVAGLLIALVTPDASIIGSVGLDVGLIAEAFRQAVGTLLTPMVDPG